MYLYDFNTLGVDIDPTPVKVFRSGGTSKVSGTGCDNDNCSVDNASYLFTLCPHPCVPKNVD